MRDFVETAEHVGSRVVSQSDENALRDVHLRVDNHARRPVSKLRFTFYAAAAPALLAVATVGTLMVRAQLHQPGPHQGVAATGSSPTALAPAVSSSPPAQASPTSVPNPKPGASSNPNPGIGGNAAAPPASTPTQPPPPPSANLLPNPSFETGTAGWQSFQGAISRVSYSGAPQGLYVAMVRYGSGCDFSVNTDESRNGSNNIYGTAGKTYTATAWVRAATPSSVGKTIRLDIRERHGGTSDANTVSDIASPTVTLTNTFQRLTVSFVDTYSGDYLDIYAMQFGACSSSDAFYADAFSLTAS